MSRLPMTVGAPYRGQGYGYRGRPITNPWEQAALANALTNQQVATQDAMTAQPVAFGGVRDVQPGGRISGDSPLTRLAVKTADGRYYMAPPPSAVPSLAPQAVPNDRGASFHRIAGVGKDNTNYQAATSWGNQASPEAKRYLGMVGQRREAEANRVANRRADFVQRMGYDPVLDRAKAKQAMSNSRYTGLDPGLGYMLQGGGAPGGMGNAIGALALTGNPAALELSRQQNALGIAGINASGHVEQARILAEARAKGATPAQEAQMVVIMQSTTMTDAEKLAAMQRIFAEGGGAPDGLGASLQPEGPPAPVEPPLMQFDPNKSLFEGAFKFRPSPKVYPKAIESPPELGRGWGPRRGTAIMGW